MVISKSEGESRHLLRGAIKDNMEECKQIVEDTISEPTPSTTMNADDINHPKYYETGKFECIDVMAEAIGREDVKGFCICNAFKYLYRCKSKHTEPTEDIKKAIWYLQKYLELEGKADG